MGNARRFLDYLGDSDQDRSAIHVAGINGRGSVYAFLTSILGEVGYSTGTFISLHLVEVHERPLTNGGTVDQENFEGASEAVLEINRKLAGQKLCHSTPFELLFYMAIVLFRTHDVDAMILETGMGGKLNITNVLERPTTYMITSIGMNHTRYPGSTLVKIAGEKIGIIKTDVPLVFDDRQLEVSTILEEFAFRKGAAGYPVGRDDFHVEEIGEGGLSINVGVKNGRCLELKVPFEAFYQTENTMLAVRTLGALHYPGECPRTGCRMPRHGPYVCPDGKEWGISDQHIIKGLKNTS